MLESESCKSSINGEGEGEFRKELFSHLRGFTFLGPPFENLQGMFLIVTSSTISVFKHSSKEKGREGNHLANCLKSQLHFVSFLRSNDCSTSTPLMFSWAWQKGQGCFFLQLSFFLWGRVRRMCWSVSKFICLDWRCIFLFVFMLGSKLTASYIFTWMQPEHVTSASQFDPYILSCPSSLRFWLGQMILLKILPPKIIESHIKQLSFRSYRT